MHVLRFFLMPSLPTTRGCAPARPYIPALTRSPRPPSPPSTNPPAALCTIAHGLDRLFRCLTIDLLRPKPPFKSHSAPRPPQTPAASSLSPYRKRLETISSSNPKCHAEAFPIKASDDTS